MRTPCLSLLFATLVSLFCSCSHDLSDTNALTMQKAIEIFDKMKDNPGNASGIILSDLNTFEECMTFGTDEQVCRMYMDAFILKKGAIRIMLQKFEPEVVGVKYSAPFYKRSQLWDAFRQLYEKSGKEERKKMSEFFEAAKSTHLYCHTYKSKIVLEAILGLQDVKENFELMHSFMSGNAGGILFNAESFKGRPFVIAMLKFIFKDDLHRGKAFQKSYNNVAWSNCHVWKHLPDFIIESSRGGNPFDILIKFMKKSHEGYEFNHPLVLIEDAELGEEFFKSLIGNNEWNIIMVMLKRRPSKKLYSHLFKLGFSTFVELIGKGDCGDFLFKHCLETIHAIILGLKMSDTVAAKCRNILRCNLNLFESVVVKRDSTETDFFAKNVPDEVLERILYYSCDCIAFSELVLRRVCSRWNGLLPLYKVIVNSLCVARTFSNCTISNCEDMWRSFPSISSLNMVALLVDILKLWTVKELKLNRESMRDILSRIPEMKGVLVDDLAVILDKFSKWDADIRLLIFEKLPCPVYYSYDDMFKLAKHLLKHDTVPITANIEMAPGLVYLDVLSTTDSEAFGKVLSQINFNGHQHIPVMEHTLYGKHEKAVIDAIRRKFKHLKDDELVSISVAHLECKQCRPWLYVRFLARMIMEDRLDKATLSSQHRPLFFLAALLDAKSTLEFGRGFAFCELYWRDELKSSFFGAVSYLAEDRIFNSPGL